MKCGRIWPLSGVKGQEISQAHLAAIGCNGLTACSEAKQVADEKVLFPDTYTILLDLKLLSILFQPLLPVFVTFV